MSLYFDYKVQSPDPAGININIEWHLQHPLLAVASYSQERGGFVTIFDELGDPLQDVTFPQHPVAQVTSMAWHPMKKVLATGWENGELRVWVGETEFMNVQSPHQMPITILDWSEQGGRLVSGDTSGSLVGWKIDPRGQILTVFHSELKDPLIHIVFRRSQPKTPGFDISGLAKAAVAGDEQALDMFSAWRPRTAGQRFNFQASQGDNMCFFIGSVSGLLFYFNEDGTCTEVLSTDGSVLKKLLYHDRKDNLIVMTEGLNIGQFAVDVSGALSEITKVKLSGRSQDASMVWAGPGLLAVSTGDLSIRCWDMDTGENYVLEYTSVSSSSMANNNSGNTSTLPTEIFTSLAFTASKGLLCGGTNHGNIIMWKYNQQVANGLEPDSGADPAQAWQLEAPSNVRGAVKQLGWGSANSLLAVNTITNVFILKEQLLCSAYGQQVSAVQVSPNRLLVEVLATSITGQKRHSLDLKTDLQVKGVAVSAKHVAVWSNKTLVVYQLCTEGIGDDVKTTSKVVGTFSCEVESAVMFEQSLIVLSEETIHLRTFQGTVKQNLILTDTEGQPLSMELCGSFLTVSTTAGVVKLWDLSRREAKPHAQPKILDEEISDFGEIIMARCNSNGSKVSISIAKSNFIPDPKLFIWDIDTDSVQYFNFATGKLDIQETEELSITPVSSAASVRSRTQRMANNNVNTEFDCAGRFVLSHHWDAEEPKLLVCEAKLLPKTSNNKEGPGWPKRISSSTVAVMADVDSKQQGNDSVSEIILVTFFTTPEQGLIIQDIMPLSKNYTGLLGVQTPNYLLLKKLSDQDAKNQMVDLVVMRDFEGLEGADKPTRDAVLNFSYNLSIGNMDEAFRAIKTIRSEAVWESLARMCVKTKRLDVAWVCLGHMKHARGAMALRQASKEPEMEARVGMLAVQLGLVEEAERLYISCGRYDLLNQLYQASGEWDKALRVAEEQDRIHLRTTYFNYASHLEGKGDFPGAAHMYERSDTHRFQVPRMLLDDQLSLESYVLKSKDPQLVKWWAQYMESTGQMDLALQYYEEAHDYYSLVRVLCFQENLERASEVASTTGDRAACYHLARQYEALGKISEAVHFFTRAQAYGNAVRICKEHGLEDQLWTLALLAGPREQVEAAQYFECGGDRSSPDKAVMLYHRAGMLHKALDLAFRTQQFSALQHIAVDLNSNSDPALIEKCARFFVENKQFQKAVDLLAVGKQYVEALNLCLEHRIAVTEDLAEKLTMPKGEGDEETRVHVLEKVADTLLAQGNYHLATKKFAQAGNKIKAIKALLKTGDTEKIIFFASVSRQKEIYIMAANYLQSLDWKSNPEVLKNIVNFYTRAKALELLANFYVACAQVEVDEYQNYEKAYGALSEASRCLAKVTEPNNPQHHERTVENLNRRMALVRRFVDIRRMMERSEAESGLEECRRLLQDYTEENSELEAAVRKGDIYALMVEYLAGKGDFKGAHKLIEEFRHSTPNVNLPFYLGTAVLEKVARGVGLPLSVIAPTPPKEDKLVFGRHTSHDEEEEEEEGEVVDEVVEEGLEDEPSSPFKFMNGSAFAI